MPFRGILCDSKPILAVAYRNQYPERGLLRVQDFSGGTGGAVRALRRLGFDTVTRAQLQPPALGTEYDNRTQIYEAYGGDRVAGIIRFPGEDIVNVFSDADGPYADDPPTLTEPFGYRGEGLNGPQQLTAGGNARLEQARITRAPVRFWYRPTGGRFSFLAWVVVLGRAWISGVGLDGQPRPELEWRLEAVPGPAPDQWPREVVQALEDSAATADGDDAAAPEAQAAPSYAALLERIDQRGQPRRPNGVCAHRLPPQRRRSTGRAHSLRRSLREPPLYRHASRNRPAWPTHPGCRPHPGPSPRRRGSSSQHGGAVPQLPCLQDPRPQRRPVAPGTHPGRRSKPTNAPSLRRPD